MISKNLQSRDSCPLSRDIFAYHDFQYTLYVYVYVWRLREYENAQTWWRDQDIGGFSQKKRGRERERERERKVKKLAKRAWKIWHSIRSSYPSIYLQYFPTSTFRNASCSRTNYAPYCLSFKERRRRNCRRPVSALISEGEETSFQGRRKR